MHKSKVLNKHVLAALVPGARVDNTTFEIAVETDADASTIIFNVGGVIFETYRSTLCRHNDTNVSDEAFLEKFYRHRQNDYFFDHDPTCFSAVLEYLRTGELHLPPNVCGPALKRELDFWGVSEHLIQNCCWNTYDSWNSTFESLQQLERDRKKIFVEYESADPEELTRWHRFRRNTWNFLTNQTSSWGAKVYGVIAILFVILSILTFILETHPSFRVPGERDMLGRLYRQGSNTTEEIDLWIPHPAIVVIDIMCVAFFTFEILIRFICSPNQLKFFINFFNLVDVISLLPDYIEVIVFSMTADDTVTSIVHYINFLRLMRVFRVFRLVRHVSGLWIMIYTLKASMGDLLLMCIFMMMGMLLFASLIYYVEDSNFPNIPISLWWALITMTTVGYGDMYPERNMGYLIGSLCAMTGLLVVGFTVPIIVNHFVLYYTHIQSATRAEKRKKKSAKEKKTLENMIEEERRESVLIGMNKNLNVSGQLSNGKENDHNRFCNGDVVSAAERKRASGLVCTKIQPEVIKTNIFLPPKYSTLSDLDDKLSTRKKDNPFQIKDKMQTRRKSLPTAALIPSQRTGSCPHRSIKQEDKTKAELIANSATPSDSESNITIEFGSRDLQDAGTTYM